jgi:hypothetical protein
MIHNKTGSMGCILRRHDLTVRGFVVSPPYYSKMTVPSTSARSTLRTPERFHLIKPGIGHICEDYNDLPFLRSNNPTLPIYDFSCLPPWGRRIDTLYVDASSVKEQQEYARDLLEKLAPKHIAPTLRCYPGLSVDISEEYSFPEPKTYDPRAGLAYQAPCDDYTLEDEASLASKEAAFPDWPEDDYLPATSFSTFSRSTPSLSYSLSTSSSSPRIPTPPPPVEPTQARRGSSAKVRNSQSHPCLSPL